MKNTFFFKALVLIFILVGIISCSNEESFEKLNSDYDQIQTDLYLGIGIIEDNNYGSHLSFDSFERLDSITNVLEDYSESKLDDWLKELNFESLWDTQINQNTNPENWYPSDVFAALLSPSGIIMIDNKLYQDTKNGELVYSLKNGKKKVFYEKINESIRSSCLRKDDNGLGFDLCGGPGSVPRLKVKGMIDHYTFWISGNERLYIKTWLHWQKCSGSGGWNSAKGDLDFSYSYDLTVDGNNSSGTNSYTRYNDNYHSIKVESGNDICINSVYATHKGEWNLADATTNTSVY